MRHKKSGRQFGRNTSQPARHVAQPRRRTSSSTSASRRRTPRPRSFGASPSGSSPRPRRLGTVAYTPQAELLAGRQGASARGARACRGVHPALRRADRGGRRVEAVDLVEKVFVDLAKRFASRPGGYTRIVKFGPRRGDNAPISLIELVGEARRGGPGQGRREGDGASSKVATAAAPTQAAKVE